jgi:hypothetical protein
MFKFLWPSAVSNMMILHQWQAIVHNYFHKNKKKMVGAEAPSWLGVGSDVVGEEGDDGLDGVECHVVEGEKVEIVSEVRGKVVDGEGVGVGVEREGDGGGGGVCHDLKSCGQRPC